MWEGLDAVTVDGHGTLLQLVDPLGALCRLLPEFEPAAVERAFRAEGEYYGQHSHEGRDAAGLARMRAECTEVFNAELGSRLSPEAYLGAFCFAPIPGAVESLARLTSLGLSLAVVANWDYGVHEHLAEHGLTRWFDTVVCSAELGVKKPDPKPFLLALERLGVEPSRALHVGDHRPHDEAGALAAGMRFAPAPLAGLFAA
jgi:putative hydrolase of the HAD superfamily